MICSASLGGRLFNVAARSWRAVTSSSRRKRTELLADLLDNVEGGRTALLAHGVAKDATEQPNVFAQRKFLVLALDCR